MGTAIDSEVIGESAGSWRMGTMGTADSTVGRGELSASVKVDGAAPGVGCIDVLGVLCEPGSVFDDAVLPCWVSFLTSVKLQKYIVVAIWYILSSPECFMVIYKTVSLLDATHYGKGAYIL